MPKEKEGRAVAVLVRDGVFWGFGAEVSGGGVDSTVGIWRLMNE